MKAPLFLLAILGIGGATAPAGATEYPWCANFHDGAGSNCGFTSYEQCMLTARGSGGYCAENTFYKQPAATAHPRPAGHARRAKKKKSE